MKAKIPHVFVLLMIMIILGAVLTYIVPAGEFERVEDPETGRTVIDPDSFEYVDPSPVGPFEVFMSVQLGMIDAANIIFFVFIVGGAFGMIRATGVIEAGIGKAMNKLQGRETLLLIAIMLITALGGASFGLAEEFIPLVPVGVLLARKLRYDAMVGMAIFMVAVRGGFASGAMNPFTVGVAQGIAELPIFSGLGFRWAIFAVITLVTIWYVMRYAKKVKENPESGVMYDLELEAAKENDIHAEEVPEFEARHTRVLIAAVIGFIALIYGVLELGWFINELATLFLILGIVGGLVGSVGPNKLAEGFVAGAKDLALGALVIGIARGILVVLEQGLIVDTIIFSAGSWLAAMPTMLAANGMFVFHLLFNFLVPSGSGQAATTMPIMIPIADLADITRQTAVVAYNLGDGMSNQIFPTVGALMAALGLANIPYERYFKFIWPLVLMYAAIGFIFVTIAVAINLGPF